MIDWITELDDLEAAAARTVPVQQRRAIGGEALVAASTPEESTAGNILSVVRQDGSEILALLAPQSEVPTAYKDSLHFGVEHPHMTFIWGTVKNNLNATDGEKVAVLFDSRDCTQPGDVAAILRHAAGSMGGGVLDVREEYGPHNWRHVYLRP